MPAMRRGIVIVVGFVALAVLPVLALNSLATAGTGSAIEPGMSGEVHVAARPVVTEGQRQCLVDHGVTPPARAADAALSPRTQALRDAFREAALACGLVRGRGAGGDAASARI
jgi:hypothetical protein